MSEFLQQLLNGLSLGAIYALIALGLVLFMITFVTIASARLLLGRGGTK